MQWQSTFFLGCCGRPPALCHVLWLSFFALQSEHVKSVCVASCLCIAVRVGGRQTPQKRTWNPKSIYCKIVFLSEDTLDYLFQSARLCPGQRSRKRRPTPLMSTTLNLERCQIGHIHAGTISKVTTILLHWVEIVRVPMFLWEASSWALTCKDTRHSCCSLLLPCIKAFL